MKVPFGRTARLAILLALTLAACNYSPPQAPAAQLLTASQKTQPAGCVENPIHPGECQPTPLPSTVTASSLPTSSPTLPSILTSTAESPTPEPATASPLPQLTACPPDYCIYSAARFLQRPIQPPGNDSFDTSYRFGSTQSGLRDPHHGIEFLNPYGTPVLAAGDGIVVVAGTDLNPTSAHGVWPITFYGPYSNFYGNLVVIEHTLPASLAVIPNLPLPFYTLYGHLSEIRVQPGQTVSAGQEIGKVGQAGIATGSHLHFEVRLGENSYKASHNPELWLSARSGSGSQPAGAIAGSFIDAYGNSLEMPSIVLDHLPDGPDGSSDFQVSLITYEEKGIRGLPPYNESFAVGDLPIGWYRISFPMGGLREELVQILPEAVTAVVFRSQ